MIVCVCVHSWALTASHSTVIASLRILRCRICLCKLAAGAYQLGLSGRSKSARAHMTWVSMTGIFYAERDAHQVKDVRQHVTASMESDFAVADESSATTDAPGGVG